MSVPLTPSVDKNRITARRACLEESVARSLTVISLLFQSTTRCRYRVYTKFLLTYSAIYWRNRKVLLLGITALRAQSHFHLGMPYKFSKIFVGWKPCQYTSVSETDCVIIIRVLLMKTQLVGLWNACLLEPPDPAVSLVRVYRNTHIDPLSFLKSKILGGTYTYHSLQDPQHLRW